MIAKGTTHNNGAKLARYMTTGKEGERAELWQTCRLCGWRYSRGIPFGSRHG